MNKFQDILPITKEEARQLILTNNREKIASALVAIAFYEPDWHWAQDLCLEHLFSSDDEISGLAATCLGHIARIHRRLEKNKVLSLLRSRMENGNISGRIEDAINDIQLFIKE